MDSSLDRVVIEQSALTAISNSTLHNPMANVSLDDNCTSVRDEYGRKLPDMLYERFVVFGAFGTGVASVGIILNICLSVLLICRTEKLIKYNLFLIALAVLDTIISILYILLMAIGIIYDYVGSLTLYRIWIAYVPVANVVGRVVQPAQTYLIVVVTIERYFAIANVRRKILKFFHQQRVYVLVGLVLFAVAFKGSSYWEIHVVEADNCDWFTSKSLEKTLLNNDDFYKNVYTFWMQPIVLTYVPFVLLLIINCLIIRNFYFPRNSHQPELLSTEMQNSRKQAKDAVLTTVAIVTCYLCSNCLSLILSILEMIHDDMFKGSPLLYHLLSDFTSFMVMVVCCIRYPLYLLCNTTIRRETRKALILPKSWKCHSSTHSLGFKQQFNQFVRVSEVEIFV